MTVSRVRGRVRTASITAVGAVFLLVSVSASALTTTTADSVPVSPATASVNTPTTSTASSPLAPATTAQPAPTSASSATPSAVAVSKAAVATSSKAGVPSPPATARVVHQAISLTQASGSPTAPPGNSPTTAPSYAGWRADWVDNFNVPIDQTKWGRYGWGYQVPGQGAMGRYLQSNTFTSNGIMTLRTQYANGEWSSAGVSSGDFYAVSGGRWEFRAKFPVSKGIGYAFLLYPDDDTWPPEIDIAEGRVNGPQIMGVYHYDSDNKQSQVFTNNATMSDWHTYGVIVGATTITYTIDGKTWATVTNPSVSTKKFWIGFQCGAMDPNGSAKQYETVDNGVPGPLTPAISDIQIDWVAHYVTA